MSVDVGSVDEIPVGEGRTFAVEGTQVAVFRLRDGSLRAVDAVCPHRGGPLADGLADDCVVVCPLHGHTFDMSTGSEVTGADLSVRSYPVDAVDGTIRLTL
ncbi:MULTISPECIES: Rieske (2Fe-2S) protein [Mycolicibacterium]|jgi:nitrite reductase (NADH) small subunit|uniref:Nitrite reductase (NAD(P)H) small subunit n=1 Tax=Mycolicibacterium austroafricanum TaxID=39687 RepID=A0ABT8HGA8_MYCAO|nr:Rieske 2Fe-2S domain-containing protein [Mycolicibacterium austroafricanum]MDN4519798.1 nitrite reductase (NAD(P)H) small subunit [Mycolicibacterium austroafricanum]PQP38924.1 (2Fe-2S)-binding protein [Mycolicibacterium austroafricanum]QRZ04793.1 nitrite reductase (NAD(P)H) small subunit [Mycolicibacterium austroafricanum]QZT65267.1 nitrite reductase (NAD(P)H) small subunit [Mycolicibacterium austroafricanum]QZT66536.1 nitrite reductase (NAD(P)H) small subunit [Mycolicibacterium austroafric